VIDRMLAELSAQLEELGVPGSWRRRVVTEARDHLEELAAEGEDVAVRRFGDVGDVARLVAAQLATAGTRTATYLAFGALALTGLVYAASLALIQPAGGWPDVTSGRIGAVGPILAVSLAVLPQIAFVSGCLALIRAFRLRAVDAAPGAELSLVRRRTAVALACGTGTLGALALSAANDGGSLAGWWVRGTIAACVVLTVPLGVATGSLVRSSSAVVLGGGQPGGVFDDLAPLVSVSPLRRLDLPNHPWRFAGLSAAMVGLAGAAAGWYAEGDLGSALVRGGFEAAALLICFALLGRLLGLRQSKR
jgi:HAAS